MAALFLISNFTFILGVIVFVEPSLAAPNYLTLAAKNSNQIILGALLELINGVAYLGIVAFGISSPNLGVSFSSRKRLDPVLQLDCV